MSEQGGLLVFISRDILHYNIVCIDIDRLKPNNQLLKWISSLRIISSHDEYICIIYFQFMLPKCQESSILRLKSIKPNKEEAKFFILFVTQEIKAVVLMIIDYSSYLINFVLLVQVKKLASLPVIPVPISTWGHNEYVLIEIHVEVHWLLVQLRLELKDCGHSLRFNV